MADAFAIGTWQVALERRGQAQALRADYAPAYRPVPRSRLPTMRIHGKTRRRISVSFDDELRALTREVAASTREMIAEGRTPPPVYESRAAASPARSSSSAGRRRSSAAGASSVAGAADLGGGGRRLSRRPSHMRRHLNTLYVTTQGAWLSKDGANVVVAVEGAERAACRSTRWAASSASAGSASARPCSGFCAEEGVASPSSASTAGSSPGSKARSPATCCCAASSTAAPTTRTAAPRSSAAFVIGKALNQRAVLRRALRDHGERMDAEAAARCRRRKRGSPTSPADRPARSRSTRLRGLEGEAGATSTSALSII